jgi:hypothetical protein
MLDINQSRFVLEIRTVDPLEEDLQILNELITRIHKLQT